jgi:hypothetical protein
MTKTILLSIYIFGCFLQSNLYSENRYKVQLVDFLGYTYVDTLVTIEYIEDNLREFIKFNYPEVSPTTITNKEIVLEKDSLKFIIQSAPFDTSKYEYTYSDKNAVGSDLKYVSKINGKDYWGSSFGYLPAECVSSMKIIISNRIFDVPNSYYDDLFNPRFGDYLCETGDSNVKGYLSDLNEFIVTMHFSDGAGAYIAIFIFKNESLKKRIVGVQF